MAPPDQVRSARRQGERRRTPEEARKTILDRYRTFAQRMRQADEDDVLERYMNALTTSYDPHTSYFSPNSFEDFVSGSS